MPTVFNRNPDAVHNRIGSSDAAFVPIEDPNIIVGSTVQAANGTIMNVTQGSLSDIPRWSNVSIYGNVTNDEGRLFYRNATVSVYSFPLFNMGIASYDSERGDSGASIIHHNASGSHNIVGMHMGGVCVFESPSEGQSQINVTSYPVWCDRANDAYYYKTFSAWENIKSDLNIP